MELESSLHFDDSLQDLELLEDTDVDSRIVPHPADVENHPDKVEHFEKTF